MTPTVLAQTQDTTGEGLIWVPEEQAVYWVDINGFRVHRYATQTGQVTDWLFTEPPVALSPTTRPGTLLVALASRLEYWSPKEDLRRPQGFVLPNHTDFRLNDGRSDPLGNFWVGSMMERIGPDGQGSGVQEHLGELYRIRPNGIRPNGEVTRWRSGMGIPNTLCWSPGRTHFYLGDSERNTIYRYDFDPQTGSIAHEQVFFHHDKDGVPDGSAIDAEGYLWNCRYGGACLLRISPQGQVVQRIPMPVQNPTTCAFGGPDLRTLFITSASKDDDSPLAGSLFSLQAPVPGLEAYRFKIG